MQRVILTFLFFLVLPVMVFAQHPDLGWMSSYTAETADKKYIFVMRRKGGDDYLVGDRYPQSGMYLNDGSNTPLWTADWKNRVYLPNDGKHVVRLGRLYYTAAYRDEAFAFIAEGKTLKTYQTRDLVDFPYLLPHTSAGYGISCSPLAIGLPNDGALMRVDKNGEGYPINSGAVIDNEKNTIQIETFHSDKYVFDLNTGNIIASYRPTRTAAILMLCALAIGYFAYLFLAVRMNLTEKALKIASHTVGFFLILFLFLIPIISVWIYKLPFNKDLPDYPEFFTLCWLQVPMLPRFLLFSLNLIPSPENNVLYVDNETILQWLIFFWIPCVIFAGFVNQLFTRNLQRFTKYR